MMWRIFPLAIALIPMASASQASIEKSASDPTVVEATKSATADDKIICKGKRSFSTGSHMRPKKECRTESEWRERELAAKRELQRLQEKQQTHGMGEGR